MAKKEELLTYRLEANWHCQKGLEELEQLVEEQRLPLSKLTLPCEAQEHVLLL